MDDILTMDKSKQVSPSSFRLSDEVSQKFKDFCKDGNYTQDQGLRHLLDILELENAKGILPDRKADIESFQAYLQQILKSYTASLQFAKDSDLRASMKYEEQLTQKDKTIGSLQEKVEDLTTKLQSANSLKEDADKAKEAAEKSADKDRKMLESITSDRDSQKEINETLSKKLADSEKKLAGYDDLKKSESNLKNELAKTQQQLLDEKKDHEIADLKLEESRIQELIAEKSKLEGMVSLLQKEK